MSYVITHTDGRIFKTIGEGALDTSTGLALIGQNYHNYGQLIANNFIRLLENQSNATQPPNPIAGQLWWNSSTKVLSYFDGARFKPCSSSAVGINTPLSPIEGDQWWDVNTAQLKVFSGTDWVVIGPNYVRGRGYTGTSTLDVTDASSFSHHIGLLQVDGTTLAILNKDYPFTLSRSIDGIELVGQGITLTPNAIITGTSTNANKLNNVSANNYVRNDTASNTLVGDLVVRGLSGLTVGFNGNLNITSDSHGTQRISNETGNVSISAGTTSIVVSRETGEVLSSVDPTTDMGLTTKRYVDELVRNVDQSSTDYVDASVNAVVAGASISTLDGLSRALNNDPNFYINNDVLLSLKAPLNSPQFTGIPLAPTPALSDNSAKIATTSFVKQILTTGGITTVGTLANLTVTGNVVADKFIGSGAELTNIPNSALVNSTIKLGSTTIPLGSTVTTINNLSSITSNVVYGSFFGNITGTILTSVQPNITQLGTLSNLNVQGNSNFSDVVINGDLTVNGNTTTVNTSTLTVTDLNITLANGATTTTAANGAGLTVGGPANATLLYASSTDSWNFNKAVKATSFDGIALQAKYADLAENYVADAEYLSGTVVVFGGDHEITISQTECDSRVAGVVSFKPAYLMNSEENNGTPVALVGKVLCKVIGPVKKGDLLVTSNLPGVARVMNSTEAFQPGIVIGKSLEEDAVQNSERLINVVVGRF